MGNIEFIIFQILIVSFPSLGRPDECDEKMLIDQLLLSYDKTISPRAFSGQAVMDKVQIYINSIDSISDSTMDYTMSIYLRQRWLDQRLSYNDSTVHALEIHNQHIDKIWLPDLSFINEKESHFHDVTLPNRMMNWFPDGLISYSVRVTGTFTCSMEFHKYPLDTQICHIKLESYGYTTKTLFLRWSDPPVIMDTNLKIPQFYVISNSSYVCDKAHMEFNYTCIGYAFHLQREIGYYIIQTYIPTILIVTLSWLSFWLDAEATAARISLGLLTILTITTQSIIGRQALQKVSYIKAMDVWYATCLLFVFAALVEFAYVNINVRADTTRTRETILSNGNYLIKKHVSTCDDTVQSYKVNDISKQDQPKKPADIKVTETHCLDRYSRIFFPIAFLAFNIFYWTFYLLWKP